MRHHVEIDAPADAAWAIVTRADVLPTWFPGLSACAMTAPTVRTVTTGTGITLAEEIVANAPLSVAASRRIVLESPSWSPEEAFARQSDLAGVAVMSEDAAEGIAAFAEHREPVWRGR